MSGVDGANQCPVCGGEMETYLETKTKESDAHCRTCGYYTQSELFWERVVRLPMTHNGTILGDGLIAGHAAWTPETVARPDNCECYGCHRKDEGR